MDIKFGKQSFSKKNASTEKYLKFILQYFILVPENLFL